jgi:hypothetical protein
MLDQNVVLEPPIPSPNQPKSRDEVRLAMAKAYLSLFSSELGKMVLDDMRRQIPSTLLCQNPVSGMVDPLLTTYGLGVYQVLKGINDKMRYAVENASVTAPPPPPPPPSTLEMMYNQQPF